MKTLKAKFEEMEELEAFSDLLDAEWEADPENEDLEEAWDAAYRDSFNAFEEVISEIVRFNREQIDRNTARQMLMTKRDELRSLIAKVG